MIVVPKLSHRLSPILLIVVCLCLIASPAASQPSIPTPTPDAQVVAMDSGLRVRAAPNKAADTLTIIPSLAPLTVIGKSSGGLWLQIITADEITGWVSLEFVEVYIELASLPITYDQGLATQGNKLSPRVTQRIQKIFAEGQALGNRPDVFSKIGDSITVAPHMFIPIGTGDYYLADYEYLQAVIDAFSITEAREGMGNSFVNPSLAAGVGWSSSVMYDTDFADPTICETGETPLLCEIRVVKPSIALVMLGTNDLTQLDVGTYQGNMAGIVDALVQHGVIPILSTIPIREGYEQQSMEFNEIISEIAFDFAIPLWDYSAVMVNLANGGLDQDGVHPTIPPRGVDGAADFHDYNLGYGYVLRNLTALQMLDAVWRSVNPTP